MWIKTKAEPSHASDFKLVNVKDATFIFTEIKEDDYFFVSNAGGNTVRNKETGLNGTVYAFLEGNRVVLWSHLVSYVASNADSQQQKDVLRARLKTLLDERLSTVLVGIRNNSPFADLTG